MTTPVEDRLIFHITHIDNLPAIISDGCLWSDHQVLARPNQRTIIGFDTIKRRRLEEISVSCHPTTFVGQYVPFYFCSRSPMLYVIHRRNTELTYQGGQDRIVHLVSKIGLALQSCPGRPWAFSDGNAGAYYARFSNNLAQFNQYVDWNAVVAKYWSDPTVKEEAGGIPDVRVVSVDFRTGSRSDSAGYCQRGSAAIGECRSSTAGGNQARLVFLRQDVTRKRHD
jgi:hypothetical protein